MPKQGGIAKLIHHRKTRYRARYYAKNQNKVYSVYLTWYLSTKTLNRHTHAQQDLVDEALSQLLLFLIIQRGP